MAVIRLKYVIMLGEDDTCEYLKYVDASTQTGLTAYKRRTCRDLDMVGGRGLLAYYLRLYPFIPTCGLKDSLPKHGIRPVSKTQLGDRHCAARRSYSAATPKSK